MRIAPGLVYQEGFGIKRRGRRVVNGVLAFSVSFFFFWRFTGSVGASETISQPITCISPSPPVSLKPSPFWTNR